MRLYRIVRRLYADLSGSGGLYSPGRWHEQGVYIIYTATSIALAAFEFALHSAVRPPDTMLMEIDVLDAAGPPLTVADFIGGPLPGNWSADHGHTRPIGTSWLEGKRSIALLVPSVAIPREVNVLLNPQHPDFKTCVSLANVEPFFFDPRLFKK
jgi:RES domain-containing protein